ncbi:MAG: L,D-transpeptidase [Bdellovibrionaceae bacterium]|nr:L,D-transpeptidase [Pseudobdellovibrionaceae bacterium]
MPQFLLSLAIVLGTFTAHAQTEVALDDMMSPAEIGAEVQAQYPEFFAETFENLTWFAAGPRIEIKINKAAAAQVMYVYIDGQHTYTWPVSTGREKSENPPSGRKYFSSTPTGTWTPYGMTYLHRSRLWDADMPRAIWLTGGIAIHAAMPSYEKMLGRRASGGCIRLSMRNADLLYSLVQQYGRKNTRVTVYNR